MQGLEKAIRRLERMATDHEDGHLTIFRFTTGWKVMLGTPDLDTGYGRDEVSYLDAYPTLRKAIEACEPPDRHLGCQNWPNCDTEGCGPA